MIEILHLHNMDGPRRYYAWWSKSDKDKYSTLALILEKEMATHSSILAWRIQGWRSLVGCRLRGRTESDTTEATLQQQRQHLYVKSKKISA